MNVLRKCSRCGVPLEDSCHDSTCPRCIFEAVLTPLDRGLDSGAETESRAVSGGVQPLDRIGDYELLEEIARGGMGIVYKARQVSLDRLVAVKMLLFAQYASQEFVHRFRIEAAAAACLQHPNIVSIHEVGVCQGQHYLVMDYVDGPDLAKLIRDMPLSSERAAKYLGAVAQAIHLAHTRNILHRDLKPSNVLIDSSNSPRVTDFGLAKQMSEGGDLTLTGQILGSPNYMSPEQACGSKERLTPASDVYSLGSILYHCITGRPPFWAETVTETLRRLADAEPIAPRLLNPSVPPDLETICVKCLEKKPAARYSSAQALGEDLARFLADEPIQARPLGRWEKTWRWCRKRPALAAMSGAVVLLLLTVATGSSLAAFRIAASSKAQVREQYIANIRLAGNDIRDGNTDRALQILLSCPKEFRNWEWGRLMYQCHQAILTIPTHPVSTDLIQGSIANLAFTPDERFLVTRGDADGKLKIWRLEDGAAVYECGSITNRVRGFSVASVSGHIAVDYADGAVAILGPETHGQLQKFQLESARPAACLDPRGERIGWVTGANIAQIRQVNTKAELVEFVVPGLPVSAVRFSPDGTRLITEQRACLITWDAASGAELSRIETSQDGVSASSAHWAGRLLVTFDTNNQAHVWRPDGKHLSLGAVKGAQLGLVRRAFVNASAKLICTGGELGSARVWNAETGTEVMSIPIRVYQADFSPDGSKLATVGHDNIARVWNLQTGRESLALIGHSSILDVVRFSKSGRLVATASRNGTVNVWSATPGREVLQLDAWPWGECFSRDGKRIAASGWGLEMCVWDAESGSELARFYPDSIGTFVADFSPDGRFIATGGAEKVVRIWDSATGREERTFQGHTRSVFALAFSPDGRWLASGSADGTTRIWDVATGEELHRLPMQYPRRLAVGFAPDGRTLAVGGEVWDVQSGQRLFTLDNEKSMIWMSRFSEDGTRLYTSSRSSGQKGIRIWDSRNGKPVHAWSARNTVSGFAFSNDGTRAVAAVTEEFVYGSGVPVTEIWDTENGRELLSLHGHTEPVWGADVQPDGRRFITTSADMTLRQWEAFPWNEREYDAFPGTTLRERIAAYSRNYWRVRLRLEFAATRQPSKIPTALERDRTEWPRRHSDATRQQIDLTPHYTGLLRLPFCSTFDPDHSDQDLSDLPNGLRTFNNIQFDVRGIIQLRPGRISSWGRPWELVWGKHPAEIQLISVQQRFTRLHVLQGCAGGQTVKGTVIGVLSLHYADGEKRDISIVYGTDVLKWITPTKSADEVVSGSHSSMAWHGPWTAARPEGTELRMTRRVFLTTYENPRPGVGVASISYSSAQTDIAPFVVAMTVTSD